MSPRLSSPTFPLLPQPAVHALRFPIYPIQRAPPLLTSHPTALAHPTSYPALTTPFGEAGRDRRLRSAARPHHRHLPPPPAFSAQGGRRDSPSQRAVRRRRRRPQGRPVGPVPRPEAQGAAGGRPCSPGSASRSRARRGARFGCTTRRPLVDRCRLPLCLRVDRCSLPLRLRVDWCRLRVCLPPAPCRSVYMGPVQTSTVESLISLEILAEDFELFARAAALAAPRWGGNSRCAGSMPRRCSATAWSTAGCGERVRESVCARVLVCVDVSRQPIWVPVWATKQYKLQK